MAPSDAEMASRTTTELLCALGDRTDDSAWVQLVARYRPVIAGLARRLGLTQADADDVAQETLAEFMRSYSEGRYDRSKGRLSSWMLAIAHHTALRVQRRGRREHLPGGTAIGAIVDARTLESAWADERDRAVLARAVSVLRSASASDERTLLAFELVALRGVPAAEVGSQCGMSVEQVYVVKSRLTKRLRELVATLTAAFEEDG